MTTQPWSRRWIAALLVLLLATPTLVDARYTPSTGSNRFSPQDEIQIGREAAADTNRKLPILPEKDPLSRYVRKLGEKLARYAPGDEKWPYTFRVVNQKEINAFALPGGPIYINVGTIQAADNEAQLAGVIAHEISHVVGRHATRAATKQSYAQVPLAILGSLLGKGVGASLAQLGAQFAVGSYFLKNSRQAETEADLIGTGMMYDAGYDPRQMASFFETLEAQGGSGGPQFLSDHPNPGNRSEKVMGEVRTLPPKTKYTTNTSEFPRMQRLASQRKPLTAQEIAQGPGGSATSAGDMRGGNIDPSGSFRDLEHNAFRISYPDNWEVFGDANSAVTIAPRNCVGQQAVGCGAIINVFQPQSGDRSMNGVMRELLASMRESNPDLQPIGDVAEARINGAPAASLELTGASPMTRDGRREKERDWLLAIPRNDGNVLYMVFVSPSSEYSRLRPTFEQMARSFRMR